MKLTRARLLGIYIVLASALSWAPAVWLASEGHSWSGPYGRAAAVLLSFGPLLAALFVQGPVLKQPVLEPLGINARVNRWWLASWLLAPALLGLGLLFGWAFFGVDPVLSAQEYVAMKRALVPPADLPAFEALLRESPPASPLVLVLMGMPAGLTVNLVPALGEEIAYRGLLFREVPGGYFQRSVSIGLIWAMALLPAVLGGYLYGDARLEGALLIVGYCVLMSLVLVYLRVRSGSTVATAIARGTIMALTVAAVDLAGGASGVHHPIFGVNGLCGLLVVFVALCAHDRFFAEARLMTRPGAAR